MIAAHNIEEISFTKDTMTLKIDEKILKFVLHEISTKLEHANEFQRQFYKVSPSGYGIHWPLIDEDLSVEALIKSTQVA